MANPALSGEPVDVIVIGTGAAGLTAALRAHDSGHRVAIFEVASDVGGTSARSGGVLWVPGNHLLQATGAEDPPSAAQQYIESLTAGTHSPAALRSFVSGARQALAWLHEQVGIEFMPTTGVPDYHLDRSGARAGGRTIEPVPFPARKLGRWADRVGTGDFGAPVTTAGRSLMALPLESPPSGGTGLLYGGQALVGRLLHACLKRRIPLHTAMRATYLLTQERTVVGVRFEHDDRTVDIQASRGVVLATGGFEWAPDLVSAFLRGPIGEPCTPWTNRGDGLRMAMRLGAHLGNMREAWWTPTTMIPSLDGSARPWGVHRERARPGAIIVNLDGVRFANEATSYNAFSASMHSMDAGSFRYANTPAWLIFDYGYWRRYGFGPWSGDGPPPVGLTSAETLANLERALRIGSGTLVRTVHRWNRQAAAGQDADFARGAQRMDRWWGDVTLGDVAAATLGAIDRPPFYAVRLECSVLGTRGGPQTTTNAQVVDVDGRPIPRLYAAGDVAASAAMGIAYPGAGAPLGLAVTTGYAAGSLPVS